MKVSINKDVFKKFPKLKIVLLNIEGIDNQSKIKESKQLLKDIERYTKLTFNKETLTNHNLIAPWSVAKEEFGAKAKHYHTAVERLLKKAMKGKSSVTNNVLTNILRYIALKHLVPFGVDDKTELKGEVNFAISKGKEKADILRTVLPGALYYHDDKKVLGTKLDYWRNRKTKLRKTTVYALLHFDILPPVDSKKQSALLKETKSLVKTFCNAEIKVYTLDKKKSSLTI
jgi:DNA/RNA-binding domain of Phe-tRNA-synthetase-like protein